MSEPIFLRTKPKDPDGFYYVEFFCLNCRHSNSTWFTKGQRRPRFIICEACECRTDFV